MRYLICFWLFLIKPCLATVQLPIELNTWTTHPSTQTIPLHIAPQQDMISGIYLRVHNLKFANQLSIRLNSGEWHHVNNDTVEVFANEKLQDGIGGINATIRFIVRDVISDFLPEQTNFLHVRLNGTNGETSSARIIELNVLAENGSMLLSETDFYDVDPNDWQPIFDDQQNILLGKTLWKALLIPTIFC